MTEYGRRVLLQVWETIVTSSVLAGNKSSKRQDWRCGELLRLLWHWLLRIVSLLIYDHDIRMAGTFITSRVIA
jgi:hypothetical protein